MVVARAGSSLLGSVVIVLAATIGFAWVTAEVETYVGRVYETARLQATVRTLTQQREAEIAKLQGDVATGRILIQAAERAGTEAMTDEQRERAESQLIELGAAQAMRLDLLQAHAPDRSR